MLDNLCLMIHYTNLINVTVRRELVLVFPTQNFGPLTAIIKDATITFSKILDKTRNL